VAQHAPSGDDSAPGDADHAGVAGVAGDAGKGVW
jgi:hypothetical protein